MTRLDLGLFLLGGQQIKKQRPDFSILAQHARNKLVARAVAAAPAAVRKEHKARCARRQVQLASQLYLLERDEDFTYCHCRP